MKRRNWICFLAIAYGARPDGRKSSRPGGLRYSRAVQHRHQRPHRRLLARRQPFPDDIVLDTRHPTSDPADRHQGIQSALEHGVSAPTAGILIAERPGRRASVRNGVLDPKPNRQRTAGASAQLTGLMDLALHPRFSGNKLISSLTHKPTGDNTAREQEQCSG